MEDRFECLAGDARGRGGGRGKGKGVAGNAYSARGRGESRNSYSSGKGRRSTGNSSCGTENTEGSPDGHDPTKRRAKDDIHDEVGVTVEASRGLIERRDFDGQIRQFLHAIHGLGGRDKVRECLMLVQVGTARKTRQNMRNPSAFIGTLIKKYFEILSNENREERLRGYARSSCSDEVHRSPGSYGNAGSSPGVDTPGSVPEEAASPPLLLDVGGEHGQLLPPGCSLEVPQRVQAGQVMDLEMNNEFVCRICHDLVEDAVLLPCSHPFCRSCIRLLNNDANGRIACPTCKAPTKKDEALSTGTGDRAAWIPRWVNNIQICCLFAGEEVRAAENKDEILKEDHAARILGLRCAWVGSVRTYGAHLTGQCRVARQLRRLQLERDGCLPCEAATPAATQHALSPAQVPSGPMGATPPSADRPTVPPPPASLLGFSAPPPPASLLGGSLGGSPAPGSPLQVPASGPPRYPPAPASLGGDPYGARGCCAGGSPSHAPFGSPPPAYEPRLSNGSASGPALGSHSMACAGLPPPPLAPPAVARFEDGFAAPLLHVTGSAPPLAPPAMGGPDEAWRLNKRIEEEEDPEDLDLNQIWADTSAEGAAGASSSKGPPTSHVADGAPKHFAPPGDAAARVAAPPLAGQDPIAKLLAAAACNGAAVPNGHPPGGPRPPLVLGPGGLPWSHPNGAAGADPGAFGAYPAHPSSAAALAAAAMDVMEAAQKNQQHYQLQQQQLQQLMQTQMRQQLQHQQQRQQQQQRPLTSGGPDAPDRVTQMLPPEPSFNGERGAYPFRSPVAAQKGKEGAQKGGCGAAQNGAGCGSQKGGCDGPRKGGSAAQKGCQGKAQPTSVYAAPVAANGSARAGPKAAAGSAPQTGDHVVVQPWSPPRGSNGAQEKNMIKVFPGDQVYITRCGPEGWAHGALESGQKGWFPIAVCQRKTFEVVAAYDDSGADMLRLRVGDEVVVYHREGGGWTYGARLTVDGAPDKRGWFPSWAVDASA